MANNVNGNASPAPKAAMPSNGFTKCPPTASINKLPTIGPVQEKETSTKVNAMKNIPAKLPMLLFESILFTN